MLLLKDFRSSKPLYQKDKGFLHFLRLSVINRCKKPIQQTVGRNLDYNNKSYKDIRIVGIADFI